ncbi:hypothetical protein F4678DRAFT_485322 [Xylaria arbuscula]|nr:hypothetical protein F4678DRAFT_485322 [Xylaria arbuscula]
MAACYVGLTTNLEHLLLNVSRLKRAVDKLQVLSAVSRSSNDTFTVDKAIRTRILNALPSELHSSSKLKGLIVPHLEHTLQAVRKHDSFQIMPKAVKFAVTCAKKSMHSLKNPYFHLLLIQKKSLLHRIVGNQVKAVHFINNALLSRSQLSVNGRLHAASSHVIVQRAINHFQNKESIKKAVLFKADILRGKILRFQGKFQKSLVCLEKHAANQCKGLLFDKDLPDLMYKLADTLRELDDHTRAEQLLRRRLAHQDTALSSSVHLLKLSLAESLFAQGRFLKAEDLCSDVVSQQSLPKMIKLRLYITLAKLQHVQCDWEGAFQCWTKALVAINKFPPTSGLATSAIYLSICNTLRHEGRHKLEQKSRMHVAALEELSENAEAKYWIAGLQHWSTFLRSTDTSMYRDRDSSN